MSQYRIVYERHLRPWGYSVERLTGSNWWYVSECGLSATLWGARRAARKLIQRELLNKPTKEIIEEL